jgi:hypothetical protein
MSLRSQNPYVVSKKGLFTTNTPGVADVGQPQAGPGRVRKGNGIKHSNELPEDEEEIVQDIESSDDNTHSKHFQNKECVGLYVDYDEDTFKQFADVDFTRSKNNQKIEYMLPGLVMGAAMSVYEELLPKKLQPEEDLLPKMLPEEEDKEPDEEDTQKRLRIEQKKNQEHFQKMIQAVLKEDNSMMALSAKQEIKRSQDFNAEWQQLKKKFKAKFNIPKD